jgi:hypothetical protein
MTTSHLAIASAVARPSAASIDRAIAQAKSEAAQHLRSAERLRDRILEIQREFASLGEEPTTVDGVARWRFRRGQLRAEWDNLKRQVRELIDSKLRPAELELQRLRLLHRRR